MAHKPVTQVLLRINKALQDEITTDSGLKLFIDPSYKKEWQAAVTATIISLPLNPALKDKKILSQLSVGDEVCISYDVVADFEFKGDGHRYMPSTEDNRYVKEFVNGRGDTVRVYGLKKRNGIGLMWVATHQNKKREIIDGIQGSEEEVERWLSQFPFGKTDEYSFKNFFEYNGEDYWKCLPEQIFAKKVKGHLVAVGDRIICSPIDEVVPPEALPATMHNADVKIRYQDRARVLSGGKDKGIKKEQVISFNPSHCEKYDFYGKNYFLVNQNSVMGKWN